MEDIGSGNWGNDDEDAFVFPEKMRFCSIISVDKHA